MGIVCCKEEPVDLLSEGKKSELKGKQSRSFNRLHNKNSGIVTFYIIKVCR